jgi:arylsulfatase A-like enzyme
MRRQICRILRRFVCLTVVLCGAMLGLFGCRGNERPNIVLYVVDTLRADALHTYGNHAVQTPNYDRLGSGGTRFERAYANSSWTRATMGSLLTGEYPSTHGAIDRLGALRPQLPTLAQQLHQAGYRTAAIIANPNIGSAFGFAKGFDDFIELYSQLDARRPVMPGELIATADKVVERALSWLRSRPAQPFFLMIFSIDPHAPYTPPPPYDRRYDPDYTGNIDGSLRSMFGLGVFGKVPPPREIRHLRALYDGEVAFNDFHFGRLLDGLEQGRLQDSTVVVLTSDHGEEFYEHGSRDHGPTLYEELVRVPLIVRGPGIKSQVVDTPVQLIDLYATLSQLAGATSPPTAGRDLQRVLRGDQLPTADLLAELDLDDHQLDALVSGSRKLIRDRAHAAYQYFDLAADSGERQSLPGAAAGDLMPRLAALHERALQSAASPAPSVARAALPESARQALEALGYGNVAATPSVAPVP